PTRRVSPKPGQRRPRPVPQEAIVAGRAFPPLPQVVPPPEEAPKPRPGVLVSSFQALNDNNTAIPPDTHGAVGPNHLMVTLNSQVQIQNRSGGTISTVSLDSFWGPVRDLSSYVFDPKVLYDPFSG